MLSKNINLGKVFGINILINYSWFFIFFLVFFGLSQGYFPQLYPELNSIYYYWFAFFGSLFLFLSVLIHELSHSLVAKHFKIKVKQIILFLFGGVSGLPSEDLPAKQEFFIALAGPLMSFFLSLGFFILSLNINNLYFPVFLYLAQVNLVLGVFNLVPGYPLDGGRVFRSILNYLFKDILKATKYAAYLGKVISLSLILFGVWAIFNLGGGFWFIILGLFLYYAGSMSYKHIILKSVVEKIDLSTLYVDLPVLKDQDLNDFIRDYASNQGRFYLVNGKVFDKFRVSNKNLKISSFTYLPKSYKRKISAYNLLYSLQDRDLIKIQSGEVNQFILKEDLFNLVDKKLKDFFNH